MRLLYNVLFLVFFFLSAPFYFLKMWRRGNWCRGLGQRFGFYDSDVRRRLCGDRPVVWMHAVSVGEVNVCVPLQRELARRLPEVDWVISTTTSTGMGELRKKLPEEVVTVYYPIDFRGAVSRAWSVIRPRAVILVEAEIWPNFLWRAARERVPVMLVNARLSDRSYRGYRRFRFFLGSVFGSLAAVAAQSEEDRRRWIEVGCQTDRVECTGNLKFDIGVGGDTCRLDVEALLKRGCVALKGPVIVGGSTHAGEESVLARIFLRLKREFTDAVLILVPRHMERAAAVEKELAQLGLPCRRRSQIDAVNDMARENEMTSVNCLLVDTTGELNDFYQVADVVFVGKTLTAKGGQNPIEPAAWGKPVLAGPHMENFRDVGRLLVKSGGLIQVSDSAALERCLRQLMSDDPLREQTGRHALSVVDRNRGSVVNTAKSCKTVILGAL